MLDNWRELVYQVGVVITTGMRKLVIIIFAASALSATETRVNTMGGVPYLLIDNSNVRLYPALITNYPNEIVGEVRRPALLSFIDGGKFGILGVGINSDSVPTIVNQAIRRADFLRFLSAPPQFVVYYGKKIRKFPIGLKLNGANNYYEDSKANCSQFIRLLGGTAGLTYFFAKQTSIDFVSGIQRFGFESKYESATGDTVTFKDQGKYSFNGGVRVLSLLSRGSLFVVGGNYDKINVSWMKQGPSTASEILTSECMEVYTGLNFIPSSSTTVIFGLLVSKTESDTITAPITFNTVSYALPKIIVAMETEISDWFGVRIGANKSFNYVELKTIRTAEGGETEKKEVMDAPGNLSLGWSIKFRNFELDVMCNELPFVTSSIGLSATYKFSSF